MTYGLPGSAVLKMKNNTADNLPPIQRTAQSPVNELISLPGGMSTDQNGPYPDELVELGSTDSVVTRYHLVSLRHLHDFNSAYCPLFKI